MTLDDSSQSSAVEVVSGVKSDRTVDAHNFEFSDTNLNIKPGTVVKFIDSEGTHTVTLKQGDISIDKVLSKGQSVMLKFNKGGSYQVYCRFHGSPGSGMHTDVGVEG